MNEVEDPKDFVDRHGLEVRTYTIQSNDDHHSPVLLRYLLHLYKTGHEEKRKSVLEHLCKFSNLPVDVARAILSGQLPYEERGNTVVILHANF